MTESVYREADRSPDVLIQSGLEVIAAGLGQHRPSKLFSLFSGGHDSLVTTCVAAQHPAFSGVVHIDTGTGISETQDFVRDTCERQGWPLTVVKNTTITYLMLIAQYGFPGPAQHPMMYRYLKERPLERFVAEAKGGNRRSLIALVAGVRTQESVKRMGYVEPIRLDRRRGLWIAPIHDWSALEVSQFVGAMGLQRNPVKDMLHISGECLCGAYADKGERQEIATWFPHADERLTAYERVVKAAAQGVAEIDTKHQTWGWNGKRGEQVPENQMALPLCWYCHAGRESMEVAS